jgi:CheY-like chemotaxis protein
MKLLIIAGPYEADRIRKAALSAGFETVAVEPGESLSGWITASRPELIVMAPQIVHADPALALAKVRAVPRGRVPIFLVGDAADEARLRDLADGFFVRPIAPELLLERARAILTPRLGEPRRRKDSSLDLERTEMGIGPAAPLAVPMARPKSGPHPARPAGSTLRPLVAAALGGAPIAPVRLPGDASALLAELGAGIDALLDAELDAAVALSPEVGKRMDSKPAQPPQAERVARGDFAGETTKKVEPAQLGVVAKAPENARARLLARYAPVENGDYFAVLDVGRDASAADLRRAHERIIRQTASDSLDPGVARELAAEIEAIRAVAAEALRVLSDENLRPRYASHMPK